MPEGTNAQVCQWISLQSEEHPALTCAVAYCNAAGLKGRPRQAVFECAQSTHGDHDRELCLTVLYMVMD
jgi:hypothetical protein